MEISMQFHDFPNKIITEIVTHVTLMSRMCHRQGNREANYEIFRIFSVTDKGNNARNISSRIAQIALLLLSW